MSTRNNPGTGDPSLMYDSGIEEFRVFYSCCDSMRLI